MIPKRLDSGKQVGTVGNMFYFFHFIVQNIEWIYSTFTMNQFRFLLFNFARVIFAGSEEVESSFRNSTSIVLIIIY